MHDAHSLNHLTTDADFYHAVLFETPVIIYQRLEFSDEYTVIEESAVIQSFSTIAVKACKSHIPDHCDYYPRNDCIFSTE